MEKVKISNNVFIPMPMSIVGSMYNGKPNFMAVGWITRVNMNPPMIAIGINRGHETHDSIVENRAFSVNFPGKDLLIETDYVGMVSAARTDKSEVFEVYFGENIQAPLIKEAALSMECELVETVSLPTHSLFIGRITESWCLNEYMKNNQPDFEKACCFFLTMPDNIYWAMGENIGKAWGDGKKWIPKVKK